MIEPLKALTRSAILQITREIYLAGSTAAAFPPKAGKTDVDETTRVPSPSGSPCALPLLYV